ncbi:MAG: hypothetical protein WKG07_30370 [Hymenobacter sp.]
MTSRSTCSWPPPTSTCSFFTEQGRMFWLQAYEVPEDCQNQQGHPAAKPD